MHLFLLRYGRLPTGTFSKREGKVGNIKQHKSQKETKMKKLVLNYKGRDSWSRPVYETGNSLYADISPLKSSRPDICTKNQNQFDGEPDMPIAEDIEIEFVPFRDTWY